MIFSFIFFFHINIQSVESNSSDVQVFSGDGAGVGTCVLADCGVIGGVGKCGDEFGMLG